MIVVFSQLYAWIAPTVCLSGIQKTVHRKTPLTRPFKPHPIFSTVLALQPFPIIVQHHLARPLQDQRRNSGELP